MTDPLMVSHLRTLMRGDASRAHGGITRVGRIVRLLRPAIALQKNMVPDPPTPALPSMFRAFSQALSGIAEAHASAIGRIDVRRFDGGWMPIGTGFVVNAGTNGAHARILTAGHVMAYMVRDRSGVRQRRRIPVNTGDPRALRQTRITFADQPDPETHGIDITAVLWPHALWDVLLCEVDRPLAVSPLPLECDEAWRNALGQEEGAPMAILGYPVEQGFVPPGLRDHGGFAAVFDGSLGVRRICPGLCFGGADVPGLPADPLAAEMSLLRHDASTLGGNSGSPIFCLRTGSVVGLHTSGGQFVLGGGPDPELINRGVSMPLLLAETRMRQEIEVTVPEAERSAEVRHLRGEWSPALGDPDDETASPYIGADPATIPASLVAAAWPDPPDSRDWFYIPPMRAPQNAVIPSRDDARVVRNQRSEPACVGFALAALIDDQRRRINGNAPPISARMLYEMALTQDEWIDDRAGGTSLRAGIKGFFQSGACGEDVAPWVPGQRGWAMSRRAARDASKVTAGAYFRLRHRLADFQSAIQEMGTIVVSAYLHAGWVRSDGKRIHTIRHSQTRFKDNAAHAFAVIGYDAEGFIIQNSWGPHWGGWNGLDGVAHWSYADWAENLIDGWVVRLAPEAPSGFGLVPPGGTPGDADLPSPIRNLARAPRHALLGHVIHAERDGIVEIGRLGLGLGALREAVAELCNPNEDLHCPHLLILYHDPFFGSEAISRIAAYLTPTLLKNGIFPLHLVYGVDELTTVTARMKQEAAFVSERFGQASGEAGDYLERRAGRLCGRLMTDFMAGARAAAQPGGPLWQAGAALCIEAAKGRSLTLLSFGAGAIAASAQVDEATRMGEPLVTRLLQIAPTAVPERTGLFEHDIWPLGADRSSEDLPPYAGDWVDITQKALGQTACCPRGIPSSPTPGNLAACCTDPGILNMTIGKIKGRRPSLTMKFLQRDIC